MIRMAFPHEAPTWVKEWEKRWSSNLPEYDLFCSTFADFETKTFGWLAQFIYEEKYSLPFLLTNPNHWYNRKANKEKIRGYIHDAFTRVTPPRRKNDRTWICSV